MNTIGYQKFREIVKPDVAGHLEIFYSKNLTKFYK